MSDMYCIMLQLCLVTEWITGSYSSLQHIFRVNWICLYCGIFEYCGIFGLFNKLCLCCNFGHGSTAWSSTGCCTDLQVDMLAVGRSKEPSGSAGSHEREGGAGSQTATQPLSQPTLYPRRHICTPCKHSFIPRNTGISTNWNLKKL